MKISIKMATLILASLLLLLPLVAACGDDDETAVPTAAPTAPPVEPTAEPTAEPPEEPTEPADKVKITIGNLTDLTGPASVAMPPVNAGLKDAARYYNENNLIPGVEVEVIEYDTQADPSRDIPGWEWLKGRGADLIIGWFAATALSLAEHANIDEFPLFLSNCDPAILDPPGYVFLSSPTMDLQGWTLIKWIMENHWDWETKGPARVGGAAWETDGHPILWEQMEKYAELYPERMEWVRGLVTPVSTMSWTAEVEQLGELDYVSVPNAMPMFARDYLAAGFENTTFIGTDSAMSWFSLVEDMQLWPKLDGMLFISLTEWRTEDAEFPNLVNQLLQEYRADQIEEFTAQGTGYNSLGNGILLMEGIRHAAEAVGPENLDTQALYEGMLSAKLVWDGLTRSSWGPDKRVAADLLAIYEIDGPAKELIRVSDWLPVEKGPE